MGQAIEWITTCLGLLLFAPSSSSASAVLPLETLADHHLPLLLDLRNPTKSIDHFTPPTFVVQLFFSSPFWPLLWSSLAPYPRTAMATESRATCRSTLLKRMIQVQTHPRTRTIQPATPIPPKAATAVQAQAKQQQITCTLRSSTPAFNNLASTARTEICTRMQLVSFPFNPLIFFFLLPGFFQLSSSLLHPLTSFVSIIVTP